MNLKLLMLVAAGGFFAFMSRGQAQTGTDSTTNGSGGGSNVVVEGGSGGGIDNIEQGYNPDATMINTPGQTYDGNLYISPEQQKAHSDRQWTALVNWEAAGLRKNSKLHNAYKATLPSGASVDRNGVWLGDGRDRGGGSTIIMEGA